jgi:hypothetical protein
VSVPERGVVAGFAKKVAFAVPAAVPPEGEIVIQLGSVTEVVHAPPLHPEGPALVIVNEAEPPVANTVGTEVGAAVKVHAGITPFWETATLWPATVIAPDRGLELVLAWNVAVADPAAVPPEGEILIHVGSLTEADHDPPTHPPGLALMLNVVEPPPAGTAGTDVGVAENVQVIVAAAWLTEMLVPAMVMLPVRRLVLGFAWNVAVADPATVPLEGEMLIHVESLTELDHEPPVQPDGLALMVNVDELPPEGTVGKDDGLAEKVHVIGAAAWLMETVVPAMVMLPERGVGLGLAWNVAVDDPGAVPLEGEMLIQDESLTELDHDPPLHPLGLAVIVKRRLPPGAGIVGADMGDALKVQVGFVTFSVAGTETGTAGALVALTVIVQE